MNKIQSNQSCVKLKPSWETWKRFNQKWQISKLNSTRQSLLITKPYSCNNWLYIAPVSLMSLFFELLLNCFFVPFLCFVQELHEKHICLLLRVSWSCFFLAKGARNCTFWNYTWFNLAFTVSLVMLYVAVYTQRATDRACR